MKSAGKARNNGIYRHIRTSKEIIRNLLNDFGEYSNFQKSWKKVIAFLKSILYNKYSGRPKSP